MIQQVTKQNDFDTLAKLLNEAFVTVAKEFGLTKENSPTNNAFEHLPFEVCIMEKKITKQELNA